MTPDIWSFIFDAFDGIVEWVGSFISALFGNVTEGNAVSGALSGLLPLVAISLAGAVIFFTIRVVKKISWGY